METTENRFYHEPDKTNYGGAAFPCHTNPRPGYLADAPQGMTLRDYFAAKALTALIDTKTFDRFDLTVEDAKTTGECAALRAYAIADAMLLARGIA